MFKDSNRILVIDNEQSDLDRIAHEFNLKGIGCRTILYDGINFPDKPFSDVRVAFFDVNLGQAFSDNDMYAILENAIKSYISIDNGPFVLIFWTNNSQWKDGFIDYINRDPNNPNDVRDRIKPYYISTIDKTSISPQNTLESMLKNQLGNQIVELCLDFDEQLREASDHTINKLLSIIPNEGKWGQPDDFEEGMKKVFTKIAISAWGEFHAKRNPDGAINEALIPIVAHSLPQEHFWASFLDKNMFNEKTLNNDPLFKNNSNELLLRLNNYFHIVDKDVIDKKTRGVVVKLKVDDLFERYFNIEFTEWKKKEFGESPKIETAFPIAIEISAACDYSQQKNRNLKYLMGIANENSITTKSNKNISYLDNIGFLYQGKPLYIALDFNYVFVDFEPSIIDSVLFGFKKEMMDMIGNEYANHISRIGITSFR